MTSLAANAQAYFGKKYPAAVLYNCDFLQPPDGLTVHGTVAQDFSTGVMHPMLAVPQLGANASNELENLMLLCPRLLGEAKSLVGVEMVRRGRQNRKNKDFVNGPVLTLYTDHLAIDLEHLVSKFDEVRMEVEVVAEDEMHQSVFISYGGPDEAVVTEINSFLAGRGVETWFFPMNKLPGQKLHRMMHEGVNTHDRVLLVCSKTSLSRPGVLNEIERVLEREAGEGGSDVLIPLAIDDYLFSSEFKPKRPDIADQIKSRVAAVLPAPEVDRVGFEAELTRVLTALKRRP